MKVGEFFYLLHLIHMKLKLLIVAIVATLALVGFKTYRDTAALKAINSYESCLSAKGSLLQESYPATCVTRIGTHFTQPTPPLEAILPQDTYNDCGSALPRINFFFKAPAGWSVAKTDHSEMFQKYSLKDPNSQQRFEITCGDGFGGGGYPEEDRTKITIAGTSVDSFIHTNKETGLSTISLTYLTKDTVTFSFTGNLQRKNFSQIISSFKFTN